MEYLVSAISLCFKMGYIQPLFEPYKISSYAVEQILCRIEKWVKYLQNSKFSGLISMGVIVHFDQNKYNVAHPYTGVFQPYLDKGFHPLEKQYKGFCPLEKQYTGFCPQKRQYTVYPLSSYKCRLFAFRKCNVEFGLL